MSVISVLTADARSSLWTNRRRLMILRDRRKTLLREDMGKQFGLVIQRAARHRAIDAIEVCRKLQVIQNAACKVRAFRCREINSQPVALDLFDGFADPRIWHASEIPAFAVMPPIGSHGVIDSVVCVWLQQEPHPVFERWPDDASYVERFIRLMSKRAQRRTRACQNARV